jgi:hypothetical protein
MRELNEQELEQVAGGFHGYAVGGAEAGSAAGLKEGVYGSASEAGVIVTPHTVMAGAGNVTFAAGEFYDGVTSGAKASGKVVY